MKIKEVQEYMYLAYAVKVKVGRFTFIWESPTFRRISFLVGPTSRTVFFTLRYSMFMDIHSLTSCTQCSSLEKVCVAYIYCIA